jgi:hypothetical protein
VSAEAGPPIQPPQLSPDGKYVWDGSQWQPIADPAEPVHKGVFAAWNTIKVDPSEPVTGAPLGVQMQAPVQVEMKVREPAPPALDYAYAVDEPVTPLWQQPTRSGKTNYLYAGAGVVVFVVVVMLLNSFNFFQFPWLSTGSTSSPTASPVPSPTVDQTRSEFGRADRFLNGTLAPALAGMNDAMQQMQSCNGTLSNSCYDAINSTEPQLKTVLAVIDKATVPLCIATPMKSFRVNVVKMDVGNQYALKGYKDNKAIEVAIGLNQFVLSGQAAQADINAADQALKTQCTKDLEGP